MRSVLITVKMLLRWAVGVWLSMTALSVFIFYTVSLVMAPLAPLNARGVVASALLGSAFGCLWAALLLSVGLLRKRD